MSLIITAEHISKKFNENKPNEIVAIKDCSLEIKKGEALVLAGPSGGGKTTLLSLFGLMIRPSSGRLKILNKETTKLTERERTLFRRKHIGFLFQDFHLLPELSVLENLEIVMYPEGINISEIHKKVSELLEFLGLKDKITQKVSFLSGGEKQRVSLARSLMNDPEILIVDEPTAHLDSKRSKEILNLLENLKENGLTILIASHDPLVIKSSFIDKIINIVDGKILAN